MMRVALPGISVFLIALAIAIICGMIARWNSIYRRLANRYRGYFTSAQLWTKPRLYFNHGSANVMVSSWRRKSFRFWRVNNKQTLVAVTPWPDRRIKLEMLYPGMRSRIWGMNRHARVPTGDSELDQVFTTRSSSASETDNLFSNGVIAQIKQLLTLLGNRPFYFGIAAGKVNFGFRGHVRNEQLLDDFIRICLETYDQAIMTLSKGIDFVAEDEATIMDDVKCPICSCDIVDEMVVCVRCKTPHCKDCWKYNGKCATFGCGETRFIAPGAPLQSV